jgi:hypothetical protein
LQKTPEFVIRVRSFVAKNALEVRLLQKWTPQCCGFGPKASRTVAVSSVTTSCKKYTIGSPKSMIASDGSGPPFCPIAKRGFLLSRGREDFFDFESSVLRLKYTHVADCKPQAPPGRRWDFALELGYVRYLQIKLGPAKS